MKRLMLSVLALGLLSACSDVRENLGFDRTIPDEFAVVKRAPLSMPPDDSLPPPAPGMARPQEPNMQTKAQQSLFGGAPKSASSKTRGEHSLLNAAGSADSQPGIRQTLDRETRTMAVEDEGFVEKLIFWQEDNQPGTVVNARKEAQRIEQNVQSGKPLTEGETPMIEERQKSPIEDLF